MRRDRESGFTLVEIVIVAGLVPLIIGAIYMSIRNVSTASRTTGAATTVTEKLRTALRRISDELRTSGVRAEDRDGNKVLDPGEDLNGNGRLDSDFAVTANSITFNRFLSNGTYSLPITYRLEDGNLLRTVMIDPSGETRTAIITRQVSTFTIANAAPSLTVGLSVWVQKPGGDRVTTSSTITVVQRN